MVSIYQISILFIICLCLIFSFWAPSTDNINIAIEEATSMGHRDPQNVSRDKYRRPKETLLFFGLKPNMTVVEIWPRNGWYTEILAPIMRPQGRLYLAGFSRTASKSTEFQKQQQRNFLQKLFNKRAIYDRAIITELSYPEETIIAPVDSVDIIFTFRNIHDWMLEKNTKQIFDIFYSVLKSNGTLGIIEHRAKPGTSFNDMLRNGYLTEEYVIELAKNSGFQLVSTSEINSNYNDTTQHVNGVCSLPPLFCSCKDFKDIQKKNKCMEKYILIGEPDRMTLKFKKI